MIGALSALLTTHDLFYFFCPGFSGDVKLKRVLLATATVESLVESLQGEPVW